MGLFVLATGLLLLSLALNALLILRFVYTSGRFRPAIQAISIVTVAMLLGVYMMELVSRTWIQSDGFIETLSGQAWMEKYFHPINSLGFRDIEHDDPKETGRRLVLVVGDSFVAGHGIRNYRDRFANVLGKSLGSEWDVAIAAQGGYNTAQEAVVLGRYPFTPKVIVLSYFINDIDGAVAESGRRLDIRPNPPAPWARRFIDRSFLINALYWRWVRGQASMQRTYWDLVTYGFTDPSVWQLHTRQLQTIVDYARARDIALIAVVFPHLVLMEESAPFTGKVRDYLTAQGVPVVDMYPQLHGRSWRSLVVNPLDTHPNEQVNTETASLLLDAFRKRGLLD